jgi:hypothetical protein
LYVSRGVDHFQPCVFRTRIEAHRVDATKAAVLVLARPTLDEEADFALFRSTDFGETWRPELDGREVYDLAISEKDILALTSAGLQVGSRGGGRWEAWSPAASGQGSRRGDQIALSASGAYRLHEGKVSRMRRKDKAWQDLAAGLDEASPQWLAATPDAVFAATKEEVYTFDEAKKSWRAMGAGLSNISRLLASGAHVCAVMGNVLRCFDGPDDRNGWTRPAKGLRGEVNDLWIDPHAAGWAGTPKVIMAGTDQGLFWSIDGGESFSRVGEGAAATQPRIGSAASISPLSDGFMVAGGGSLFYVADRVPRGVSWQAVKVGIESLRGGLWTIIGAVLFLTFASTRLVSLTLQLNAPPFTWIAPWFYLSPFGRWRLYRRYRKSLLRDREVALASEYYVDLPYAATGSAGGASASPLSEAVWKALPEHAITVVADGGRGKSTLARHMALRVLRDPLHGSRRRLTPVIVEGLAYTGNLVSALTGSLRRHRAYVNETIVASQLAAGHLLVVFDGYSEIREKDRDLADEDLPAR